MTDNAIEINHVSKSYTLYSSHASMAFDWCGLYRLRFWKKRPEFPIKKALNDVSVTIEKGRRYGLIGRNGAGKTTLLKTIAGLVEPSSGSLITSGSIQSLMQVGGEGFHPEFTGRENVRFSLLYKGLRGDELEKAYNDAVEFAELGEFIDQPIKTYSLGMQSRLKFATATTVKPDILLIDEILGAGDAYFSTKSIERMRKLTNEGCTLVLVSHSKSQILDFCNEGIWLENGAVRMTGDVRQVMDAYEQATYNARNLQTKSPEIFGLLDAPQSMKRPFLRQAIESDFPNISWKDSTVGGFMREGWAHPKAEAMDLEIHSVTPLKNGKTCNWAETGESFCFQMELKNNSSQQKQVHLTTIFYGHNGDKIAADESPILTLPAGKTITVVQDFSPLQLGHRDYTVCISLNENNQVQHSLYGMYVKVNETNDTDPPLLHYSAKWYLNESLSSQDSRISGFI